MIEELKLVLDSIGDLTGVALWVVGFFIVFKLVVYLSTTGAIVYLVKLAIVKGHDFLTKDQIIKHKFEGHFIDDGVAAEFGDLLNECKTSTGVYIHSSDIRILKKALTKLKSEDKKDA